MSVSRASGLSDPSCPLQLYISSCSDEDTMDLVAQRGPSETIFNSRLHILPINNTIVTQHGVDQLP